MINLYDLGQVYLWSNWHEARNRWPGCQKEMKEIGSWSVRQELLKIVKAPVPKAPLAHSYGSASIIAHTFYQKYELKVPAYRQENDWEKLLEQKFLHADETTYRVLESETVKTFYWTFLSDKQAKKQLLYIIMIHIAVVNWPKLP